MELSINYKAVEIIRRHFCDIIWNTCTPLGSYFPRALSLLNILAYIKMSYAGKQDVIQDSQYRKVF